MAKKLHTPDIALVAVPDKIAADYVIHALKRESTSIGDVIIGAELSSDTPLPACKGEPSVLLIVPCVKQGPSQISLALRFIKTGGSVFAWTLGSDAAETPACDEWILKRLLAQTGAITSPNLGAIAVATKMLKILKATAPLSIRADVRANALCESFGAALKNRGVSDRKKSPRSMTASVTGEGLTLSNGKQSLAVRDISSALRAIDLLSMMGPLDTIPDEPIPAVNREEAFAIARPPARLLSETTSKRVISSFGMSLPGERLCRSAADASRFASSLKGPVTVKLVKPALENKAGIGAVRSDVAGHAAVRRAVNSLELLGRSLGPPAPLGYLVAEQIDADAGIRLKMLEHSKFGQIVLFGVKNARSDKPQGALSAPATALQAAKALKSFAPDFSNDSVSKLAVGIARFSRMIFELKDRVNRAEIDPLIASANREQAIAVDALVGLGG